MAGHVSDAVIRRLPGYYRHLRELESAGVEQISSQELGERMHLTPSQIRQDINCFGGFGRQGYGYKVSDLKMHIGEILGLDREHTEIIVGAGNIGCAIAKYPTFQREGFRPLAMFDNDPEKIGVPVGDIPVYSMEEMPNFLKKNMPDIAVLALPRRVAQEALDKLYACGIRALSHMRARVEVVIIARCILHTFQIIRKHITRKYTNIFLVGAKVHRVWSMCHKWSKIMFLRKA